MLRMYIYYLLLIPQIICAQKEYYIPKPLIIPSHDGKQQLYASIGEEVAITSIYLTLLRIILQFLQPAF